MIFASLQLLTSVFPGAGRGPHSRPQVQGCCWGWRMAAGSEERIAGSSGSSFSASDAAAAAAAAAAAGLADVEAAW